MSDVANLGGFTKAVTAGAAQKVQAADQPISWVVLQNDTDSVGDVLVGGPIPILRLAPGQMTDQLCVSQLSSVYVIREDNAAAATLRVLYGA